MPYHRCAACGLTSYSAAAHAAASICPSCSAPLSDGTQLHLMPGATHTIKRALAARPEAVADARREVRALPLAQESREHLALVVSELVTNVLLHADAAVGDPVGLQVRVRSGRARIEVRDCGQGFDTPVSVSPDPLAVGGQGLLIVAALSDAWGVVRGPGGCTVWCEVLVEAPARVVEHEVTGAYVRELANAMAAAGPAGGTP
jgi:anti-sigma regulatory factor (Ser/Thr protein kinase)